MESSIAVHRLSSCVTWAPVVVAQGLSFSAACGILVLRLGIEPMSPEVQSRFLTTRPQGTSLISFSSLMFGEIKGLVFILTRTIKVLEKIAIK